MMVAFRMPEVASIFCVRYTLRGFSSVLVTETMGCSTSWIVNRGTSLASKNCVWAHFLVKTNTSEQHVIELFVILQTEPKFDTKRTGKEGTCNLGARRPTSQPTRRAPRAKTECPQFSTTMTGKIIPDTTPHDSGASPLPATHSSSR